MTWVQCVGVYVIAGLCCYLPAGAEKELIEGQAKDPNTRMLSAGALRFIRGVSRTVWLATWPWWVGEKIVKRFRRGAP